MHVFKKVKTRNGHAYKRSGITGIHFSEEGIQRIPFLAGTRVRVATAKRGRKNIRVAISEVSPKKASKGFRTLVRMHRDGLTHVAFPLGFKIDRKREKGYLFTLFRPGHNLSSPAYHKLKKRQKQAVALAVINSVKYGHERGWLLRDRNATNIIFNITKNGSVIITHIDPHTAVKFKGSKKHFDELARREINYVYEMLASLG